MNNHYPLAVKKALHFQNCKERGASLVEYALLVALIAIIAVVAVQHLGETVHNQFAEVATQLGGKIDKYK